MWSEISEEVDLELAQLRRHVVLLSDLRQKVKQGPPDPVEVMALAAFLHAFYNGVENLFKRIAKRFDRESSRSELWHSQLLNQVSTPNDQRPIVITGELRDRLRPYLTFRHVFRHAYSHELKWSKMAPLVADIEIVLQQLENQTKAFLSAIKVMHDHY